VLWYLDNLLYICVTWSWRIYDCSIYVLINWVWQPPAPHLRVEASWPLSRRPLAFRPPERRRCSRSFAALARISVEPSPQSLSSSIPVIPESVVSPWSFSTTFPSLLVSRLTEIWPPSFGSSAQTEQGPNCKSSFLSRVFYTIISVFPPIQICQIWKSVEICRKIQKLSN
jgi:hypothetical protein